MPLMSAQEKRRIKLKKREDLKKRKEERLAKQKADAAREAARVAARAASGGNDEEPLRLAHILVKHTACPVTFSKRLFTDVTISREQAQEVLVGVLAELNAIDSASASASTASASPSLASAAADTAGDDPDSTSVLGAAATTDIADTAAAFAEIAASEEKEALNADGQSSLEGALAGLAVGGSGGGCAGPAGSCGDPAALFACFGRLAKEHSDCKTHSTNGDLGLVEPGQMQVRLGKTSLLVPKLCFSRVHCSSLAPLRAISLPLVPALPTHSSSLAHPSYCAPSHTSSRHHRVCS
jgi:hypothetical protein